MNAFSLRHKLLLVMITTHVVLALLFFGLSGYAFKQGFARFLAQQVLAQQDELATQIRNHYALNGSLNGWHDGFGHPGFGQRPPPHDDFPRNAPGEPRRGPPDDDRHRIIVLDAAQQPLHPGPPIPRDMVTRPVDLNGKTIAWLGYLTEHQTGLALNRTFARQQLWMLGGLTFLLLLASIGLAWGIAQWLNRRLTPMTRGADALTTGDYTARIPVDSGDELAGLAATLNRLAQTLQDNQNARQRWIIDISHELRTPLTILQGELEVLRMGIRPLDMEQVESLLQETRHLTRLVDDLHLLSQAEADELEYLREPLALSETIEQVLSQSRAECRRRELQVSFTPCPGPVTGDAARLRQLWLNLLQNTLRYTDSPGYLRIRMHRDGNGLVVDWEDSAPGVPAEDLPFLTERLFRVDRSRNSGSGGSGLGLSIASAIAKAHQAVMTPRASELGGLYWEIRFPLMTDRADHEPPHPDC